MWFLKKLFKKRDEQLSEDGDIVKPFLDHLEDLRWTLVKMIGTLAITMIAAFCFRKELAAALAYPLRQALGAASEATLISINPIESVTMSFTLSFYAGLIVSFPILFYFLAEFLLPALTRKEKKYVLPAVGVGFGLFIAGVLLCFFYVLPPTLRWLHSDAAGFGVKPSWTMKEYYGFITHMCIAVGLIFELPVVMLTLSAIELISFKWLNGMRMYGYAIALILAGIISPTPDLFMLFVFALPIMALFELCIWLVWLLEKRRSKRRAEEDRLEAEARRNAPPAPPTPTPPEDPHHDPNHGYHDSYHDEYHDQYHDEHGHYQDEHGDYHHGGNDPYHDQHAGEDGGHGQSSAASLTQGELGLTASEQTYVPPVFTMLPPL